MKMANANLNKTLYDHAARKYNMWLSLLSKVYIVYVTGQTTYQWKLIIIFKFILFQSWTLQFLLAHSNFFFLYRYSYHSRHLWILVRLPSPYLMKISKWLDQHIFINNLSLTYIFFNLFVFKCFLFLILAPFLFFKSWSPTQVKSLLVKGKQQFLH